MSHQEYTDFQMMITSYMMIMMVIMMLVRIIVAMAIMMTMILMIVVMMIVMIATVIFIKTVIDRDNDDDQIAQTTLMNKYPNFSTHLHGGFLLLDLR